MNRRDFTKYSVAGLAGLATLSVAEASVKPIEVYTPKLTSLFKWWDANNPDCPDTFHPTEQKYGQRLDWSYDNLIDIQRGLDESIAGLFAHVSRQNNKIIESKQPTIILPAKKGVRELVFITFEAPEETPDGRHIHINLDNVPLMQKILASSETYRGIKKFSLGFDVNSMSCNLFESQPITYKDGKWTLKAHLELSHTESLTLTILE